MPQVANPSQGQDGKNQHHTVTNVCGGMTGLLSHPEAMVVRACVLPRGPRQQYQAFALLKAVPDKVKRPC